MTIFFDTSVLAAALSARHPDHQGALTWLNRVLDGEAEGFLSTHALAELYAVMTGHPSWRIPTSDFLRALKEDLAIFTAIALNDQDYWDALERLVRLDLLGGGIYDALHAQAALKAGVDGLLTLNPKHFTRLGADIAALVRIP